jgi:peptide/nickel transport system substrate-binding protein
MKKVLALFLAAILMIGLTACGGTIEKPAEQTETSSESEAPVEAGPTQITIGESMQYTSLDPAHEYEGDAEMALHAAYDSLVVTPPEDESDIQPAVAESWTISEDGLTYVFTLKQGILFTTGKELKAADAAYCLNRVKGVKGNPSFLLDTVDTVEATGDYELTLTLNTPNPSLLSILTRATFGIYDSEVAIANGGTCDENDTFGAGIGKQL